jgi:hypothetical protein
MPPESSTLHPYQQTAVTAHSHVKVAARVQSVEAWLTNRRGLILLGLSLIYLAGTIAACQRPFWYDEFFTLDIARSTSPSGVVAALTQGLDRTPPLYHVINWWTTRVFGVGLIGLRVVSIAGFWLACTCVFVAVSNRFGSICGSIAFLALTLTYAEYFASEARSYALSLGFCGVALLAWQYAVILRRHRRVAVFVFGLSLFFLIGNFFLNVFVLVPFMLPELDKVWKRQRPDWPLWIAMLAGIAPIFLMLPFTSAVMRQSVSVWTYEVPSPGAIYGYYLGLVGSLGLALVAVAGVAALCGLGRSSYAAQRPEPPPFREEILVAFGFLLIPPMVVLATWLTHTYCNPRYALPAVFGIALILAGLAWQVSRSYRPFALLTAAVLFVFFFRMEIVRLRPNGAGTNTGLASLQSVVPPTGPIFVNDPESFIRMWHTWPEPDRSRLRYAYDLDLARRFTGRLQLEFNLRTLAPRTGGAIIPFSAVKDQTAPMLIYYVPDDHGNGWLFKDLSEQNANIQVIGHTGGDLLLQVQR